MCEHFLFFDEVTTSPGLKSVRQTWQQFADPLTFVSIEILEEMESRLYFRWLDLRDDLPSRLGLGPSDDFFLTVCDFRRIEKRKRNSLQHCVLVSAHRFIRVWLWGRRFFGLRSYLNNCILLDLLGSQMKFILVTTARKAVSKKNYWKCYQWNHRYPDADENIEDHLAPVLFPHWRDPVWCFWRINEYRTRCNRRSVSKFSFFL